jgi:hypothetical protein
MNWRWIYRTLVRIRNGLNVLIAAARKRAYPKKGPAIMAGGVEP